MQRPLNLPRNNLHRDFQPGETKIVDKEEIFKLSQFPGGRYMLANYLVVQDEELIKEGTYVKIVDIKGVKVIVKPIPDEQNA